HDPPVVDVERVEHLERQLRVLHGGDGERGDDDHLGGRLDHLEVELAEVRGGVDDDEVEAAPQLVHHGADMVGGDQVGQLRADRCQQHPDPLGTGGQHLIEQLAVDRAAGLDQVGDAAGVVQVEEHADIAELQVEVDQ